MFYFRPAQILVFFSIHLSYCFPLRRWLQANQTVPSSPSLHCSFHSLEFFPAPNFSPNRPPIFNLNRKRRAAFSFRLSLISPELTFFLFGSPSTFWFSILPYPFDTRVLVLNPYQTQCSQWCTLGTPLDHPLQFQEHIYVQRTCFNIKDE